MTVCYIGFREAGFFPEEVDLDTLSNENGFDYDLPHYLPRDFQEHAESIFPGEINLANAKLAYITLQSMTNHSYV